MRQWQKLCIIAGGGDLPKRLAQSCFDQDKPYFILRLKGYTDEDLQDYVGDEIGIGEVGKMLRLARDNGCDAICLAGNVKRPNFTQVKADWRGAALLPKMLSAARKGDGAILDVVVETIEQEGFMLLGAEEVLGSLKAGSGALNNFSPSTDDMADMKKASDLVKAIGPFDVGQGAIVRNGFVVAIEAAEGTDEMLRRCIELPPEMVGYTIPEEAGSKRVDRAGVLLKRPKPGQELRVDLPTIGVRTVENVAKAGLAGIAIQSENALIIDLKNVIQRADELGVFIYGYKEEEL